MQLEQVLAFIKLAREVRYGSLADFVNKVDELAARLTVIPPSQDVVQRTLTLFPTKSLPPFDEMVLGAVLTHAEMLRARGDTELFYCNLNTKDFEPTTGNDLAAAYAISGLRYLDSFQVP